MGGEPTFVSIDDFDVAGMEHRRRRPDQARAAPTTLIRRLRDRFAPGGMLHYGQGKWYPGESLPRWAFSLYWRKDGQPIWRNPDRCRAAHAETRTPATRRGREDVTGRDRGASRHRPRDVVMPAYEDPRTGSSRKAICRSMSIRSIPKIEDPEERARMVRTFDARPDQPTGFVLPVQRWNAPAAARWLSEKWPLRRGRLFLVPGDSPVGYRLPIKSPALGSGRRSIPTSSAGSAGAARSAARPLDQLSQRVSFRRRDSARRQTAASRTPSEGAVRTALSVEPRDGVICVFMPPVEQLEDYLELLAAVEVDRARRKPPVVSRAIRRRSIRASTSSR